MTLIKNTPKAVVALTLALFAENSQAAVTLATIKGAQLINGYGTSTQTVNGDTLRIEAPLSQFGRTYTLPSPLIIANQATTYMEVDIQVNAANNSSVNLALEDLDTSPAGNEVYFYTLNLSGVGSSGFTTLTVPSILNFNFRQADKDMTVNFDSGGLAVVRIAGSYNGQPTDITISEIRIIDSVPEPSCALLGVIGLGLAALRRKR